MHRPTLGIIALLLVLAGLVGLYWPSASVAYQQFANACWRVGVVLGVLWLALPQTRQLKSPVLLGVLLVAIAAISYRPRLIPVVLVALVLVALLRPRTRASGPGPVR